MWWAIGIAAYLLCGAALIGSGLCRTDKEEENRVRLGGVLLILILWPFILALLALDREPGRERR